tara:strand:- start:511 stop:705 length:195 start_codon:yes stop_codon:yes gene_type:complete
VIDEQRIQTLVRGRGRHIEIKIRGHQAAPLEKAQTPHLTTEEKADKKPNNNPNRESHHQVAFSI